MHNKPKDAYYTTLYIAMSNGFDIGEDTESDDHLGFVG